jgi:elongation factor P
MASAVTRCHKCLKLILSEPFNYSAESYGEKAMKINGNAVRPGMIIEHKGQLWRAAKTQATQPGKGGAYNQVELRNLRDGSKLNERFRAAQDVERVRLDEHPHQFLYGENDELTFMDTESYDQTSLNTKLLGDAVAFLQDGMEVVLLSYNGEILDITLPDNVTVTVADTEPIVKGQTAASSFKPAILDNGLRVMVPPHIDLGARIIVSTSDSSYVERAKD